MGHGTRLTGNIDGVVLQPQPESSPRRRVAGAQVAHVGVCGDHHVKRVAPVVIRVSVNDEGGLVVV